VSRGTTECRLCYCRVSVVIMFHFVSCVIVTSVVLLCHPLCYCFIPHVIVHQVCEQTRGVRLHWQRQGACRAAATARARLPGVMRMAAVARACRCVTCVCA